MRTNPSGLTLMSDEADEELSLIAGRDLRGGRSCFGRQGRF
jgi:hypothetical protein